MPHSNSIALTPPGPDRQGRRQGVHAGYAVNPPAERHHLDADFGASLLKHQPLKAPASSRFKPVSDSPFQPSFQEWRAAKVLWGMADTAFDNEQNLQKLAQYVPDLTIKRYCRCFVLFTRILQTFATDSAVQFVCPFPLPLPPAAVAAATIMGTPWHRPGLPATHGDVRRSRRARRGAAESYACL